MNFKTLGERFTIFFSSKPNGSWSDRVSYCAKASKNGAALDGFALAEVIISIAVIGFVLTTLQVLQSTVFRRVVINTFRVERLYPLKSLLMTMGKDEIIKKDQKPIEKKDEQGGFTKIYEHVSIKKNSSLARFDGLYQKKVTGSWVEGSKQRTLELVTYGFAPREKKSDA